MEFRGHSDNLVGVGGGVGGRGAEEEKFKILPGFWLDGGTHKTEFYEAVITCI